MIYVSPKDADEFRKYAQHASEMAARAHSQLDQELWHKLAEEWLKLAYQADENGESGIVDVPTKGST